MRTPTRAHAITAAAFAALLLAGCSSASAPAQGETVSDQGEQDAEVTTPEEGAEVPASEEDADASADPAPAWNTFEVGDCLDAADIDLTSLTVPTKPCSEPHDSEIYAETELAPGDYPADIYDQAAEFCGPEFERFIGMSYDESELEVSTLVSTPAGWELGDREVACVIILEEGGLTQSLKGSMR